MRHQNEFQEHVSTNVVIDWAQKVRRVTSKTTDEIWNRPLVSRYADQVIELLRKHQSELLKIKILQILWQDRAWWIPIVGLLTWKVKRILIVQAITDLKAGSPVGARWRGCARI